MMRLVAMLALAMLSPGVFVAGTSDVCTAGAAACTKGQSLLQVESGAAMHSAHHPHKRHRHRVAPEVLEDGALLQESAAAVPPVSTTMRCVIAVTVQYFLVYTSLAIVRSAQSATGNEYKLTGILEKASETVTYAPMISVLFIATRMRAIMLTNGDTETYHLPQWWCKDGMIVCASFVAVLTFVNIVENCMKEYSSSLTGAGAKGFLTFVKAIPTVALNAGFVVVSYGLYSMDRPKELGDSVRVSDTANCVMTLTVLYFIVQFCREVSETNDMFSTPSGATQEDSAFTKAMRTAQKDSLFFAPMLCVLFLSARMRALQMGNDAPQQWARIFFFIATYSVLVETILTTAQGLLSGSEESRKRWAILTTLSSVVMLFLYVSMTAVIISIFTIRAPEGKETPPISTTVRIVMGLTLQFFLVFILYYVFNELNNWFDKKNANLQFMVRVILAAKDSVMFCPMLCALFVGVRMRALQISHNKGAPQGWVQECMQLSAWALVFQLIMAVLEETFGKTGESKDGGKSCMTMTTTIVKHICTILLYGGVVGVCVGLFQMNEENTNGQGNLIPGIAIPSSSPSNTVR